MSNEFSKAIEWVNNTDFEKVKKIERANIEYVNDMMLLKEYIRRVALFADFLSLNIRNPIFNAASVIKNESEINFDIVCQKIKNIESGVIRVICEYYIEWSDLIDKKDNIAVKFSDLYEPALKILERGGMFGIRQGDFVIYGGGTFPVSAWRELAKDATLDLSQY